MLTKYSCDVGGGGVDPIFDQMMMKRRKTMSLPNLPEPGDRWKPCGGHLASDLSDSVSTSPKTLTPL